MCTPLIQWVTRSGTKGAKEEFFGAFLFYLIDVKLFSKGESNLGMLNCLHNYFT
jgi:hypothetical protein